MNREFVNSELSQPPSEARLRAMARHYLHSAMNAEEDCGRLAGILTFRLSEEQRKKVIHWLGEWEWQ